jgi:tripartite-type tricarboxylate transporter receptor subunit TctC
VDVSRLQLALDLTGHSTGEQPRQHYVVETDPEAGWDEEIARWYRDEHMPGLAAVPGCIRAQRYDNLDGGPRSLACYDLVTADTLGSPPWLAVRHTDWSSRTRPHFTNTRRTMMDAIIFPNAGYDVNRDFAPVTLLAKVPSLFVIHPDVPAGNLKEFIAHVRANPGRLNYGSAGNASAGHLAMEYLKLTTGMFMTHIPYRGTGPALTDLLAGRTQAFSAGTPALLPHIRSGKLRAIATGTPQRLPSLPDVPTVAESGYKGFESVQWYGVMAPGGTPPELVRRIQEECARALRSPAIAERFASEDAVTGGGPAAEFAAFIGQQQALWKNVVLRARIKAD